MSLTHFSLFAGIGGLDLAAEWAGFHSVGQVEYADYPTKVLEKHWPDVPRWRDIRDVTGDTIRRAGIAQPTVLSGGFPCQPFSCAGKRKGEDDDRYLWPEMLRVVQELRPAWVVGENVAGLVNMGLDQVLSDLEGAGYSCRAFLFPAVAVNAWHRRDRIFIVANDNRSRHNGRCEPDNSNEGGTYTRSETIRCDPSGSVPDTDNQRCEERHPSTFAKRNGTAYRGVCFGTGAMGS